MLTFTDRAREMVRSFIDQSDGELSFLRIASHGSAVAPRFELSLVGTDERIAEDREIALDDFTVLVPETSVSVLEGATVDFVEGFNGGFAIDNPNVVAACGCGSSFQAKDEVEGEAPAAGPACGSGCGAV